LKQKASTIQRFLSITALNENGTVLQHWKKVALIQKMEETLFS